MAERKNEAAPGDGKQPAPADGRLVVSAAPQTPVGADAREAILKAIASEAIASISDAKDEGDSSAVLEVLGRIATGQPQATNAPGATRSLSTNRSTLGNDEWLMVGDSLFSQDGSVEFKCQGDGKIAIYWGGECQWQNTKEQRYDVKGLIMQGDGNCVLYTKDGEAIWQTNT